MDGNLNENGSMNNDNDQEKQHFEKEYHNVDMEDDSPKSIDNDKRNQGLFRKLFMDNRGNIKAGNGTMALAKTTRVYIILGWVFAALTAFISPLFAIGGIIFGVLANKESKGSGNALIITNVVIAAVNMVFGLVLLALVRKMMLGY